MHRDGKLRAAQRATPPLLASRLALTKSEAATALGMSIDSLERYVLPHLKIVRRGSLRLIPVKELESYIERNLERGSPLP